MPKIPAGSVASPKGAPKGAAARPAAGGAVIEKAKVVKGKTSLKSLVAMGLRPVMLIVIETLFLACVVLGVLAWK